MQRKVISIISVEWSVVVNWDYLSESKYERNGCGKNGGRGHLISFEKWE